MPDIQVQDEQGTTHIFPDGSTPEMISKAMGLASKAGTSNPSSTDPGQSLLPPHWDENHPVVGDIVKSINKQTPESMMKHLEQEQTGDYRLSDNAKFLGIEGLAIGKTLAGMFNPKTYTDAFSKPATPEETQRYGGSKLPGWLNQTGVGLGRLTAEPISNLARQAKQAWQQNDPNAAANVVGSVGGMVLGSKLMEAGTEQPGRVYKNIVDLHNRAKTNEAVLRGASGVHNVAQEHINAISNSLKQEGIRATEKAIEADVNADRAAGVTGSISVTPAVSAGVKALEDVGYNASPVAKNQIAKLPRTMGNYTLKEAMDRHSDMGAAWAKADAAGDAKSAMVLDRARRDLGNSIGDRFDDLGNRKAWNYRNEKFTSSYNIQKVFADVLKTPNNPLDSVHVMQRFGDLDLGELQREMRNQGMGQRAKAMDQVKLDAANISKSYKVLTDQMGKGVIKLAMTDPQIGGSAIGAYMLTHHVLGFAGYLLSTMMGHHMSKVKAAVEAGRIGRAYPESISSIHSSGPIQDFSFPPPKAAAGGGAAVGAKGIPGSPAPVPTVAGPTRAAVKARVADFHTKGAGSEGMSGARVEELRAARQARINKANKGAPKENAQ